MGVLSFLVTGASPHVHRGSEDPGSKVLNWFTVKDKRSTTDSCTFVGVGGFYGT